MVVLDYYPEPVTHFWNLPEVEHPAVVRVSLLMVRVGYGSLNPLDLDFRVLAPAVVIGGVRNHRPGVPASLGSPTRRAVLPGTGVLPASASGSAFVAQTNTPLGPESTAAEGLRGSDHAFQILVN